MMLEMGKLTKILIVLVTFVSVFLLPFGTFAKDNPQKSEEATKAAEINSFELFWPLVAGKTQADGFTYRLKRLKEKFRELLIFSDSAKAEYKTFLATKRLLESEKLLKEDKKDLAASTLREANKTLSSAKQAFSQAKSRGDMPKEVVDNINNQLININKLAAWLVPQYSNEVKDELTKTLEIASEFNK